MGRLARKHPQSLSISGSVDEQRKGSDAKRERTHVGEAHLMCVGRGGLSEGGLTGESREPGCGRWFESCGPVNGSPSPQVSPDLACLDLCPACPISLSDDACYRAGGPARSSLSQKLYLFTHLDEWGQET